MLDLAATEGERDSLKAARDSLKAAGHSLKAASAKRISDLQTALDSEQDARGREREEVSENLRKWEGEMITVEEERDEMRQRFREQEIEMHAIKATLTSTKLTMSSLEKRVEAMMEREKELEERESVLQREHNALQVEAALDLDSVRARFRQELADTLDQARAELQLAHDIERRREGEIMALRDTDACIVAGLEKALDEGRRLHAQVLSKIKGGAC